MRMSRRAAIAGATLAVSLPAAAAALASPSERPVGDVSAYVAELRTAAALAGEAASVNGRLAADGAKGCARVSPAASSLAAAAAAARDVFERYRRAKTRYGTQEELQLITRVALDLREARAGLSKAAGEPAAPPTAAQRAGAEREVGLFQAVVAQRIADRLEIEGLADVLSSTSFAELGRKVTAELHQRLRARAETELKRLTGLPIRLDVPLGRQIRDFLESELSRALTKLVVAAGPAGIVVSLLAGKLLDPGRLVALVGRKLREALREKGDVERRARASIAGLDKLRRPLNASADTPVDRIREALRAAKRELGRTRFLEGDLEATIRATADPAVKEARGALLEQLRGAKKSLERAINLAALRFLLDSQLVGEDFGVAASYAKATLADAERHAKRLGCPITSPKPPQPGGGGTNATPTAAVCVPKTIRMEFFSDLGGKLGEYDAVFARIEPMPGTPFSHKCLWLVEGTQNEAFVVFIERIPIGTPGAIPSGNCAGGRADSHPFYWSRKRQLGVNGGERISFQRAVVGTDKVLKGVLAAAEAAGVGLPCPSG